MNESEPGWSRSYIREVEYITSYYREITPVHMAYVARLNGYRAPSMERGFTFFELGCGQGYCASIMAAANPHGRFFGNDFNPPHIVNAREIVDSAGLGNITFLEASFDGLLNEDLPPCDMIALHGIYSWVGPGDRQAIRDFIKKQLKPGGLAYVSYNCLPGLAIEAPLRRLMHDRCLETQGSLSAGVDDAVEFAKALAESGAKYFSTSSTARRAIKDVDSQSRDYVAHEYFNHNWEPFYHADLVRDLAEADLTFIGSADFRKNHTHLMLSKEAQALVGESASTTMRETIKDFFANRRFRNDIFMRGATKLTPLAAREELGATAFMLSVARDDVKTEKKFHGGNMSFKPALFFPVADALAGGPRALSELVAEPRLKQKGEEAVIGAVNMLVAMGQAIPVLSGPERTAADKADAGAAERLNDVLLRRIHQGLKTTTLAAKAAGTGIELDFLDCMLILADRQGLDDVAGFVWNAVKQNEVRLEKDKETLETDEEKRAEIAARIEIFNKTRRPLYRCLGIH